MNYHYEQIGQVCATFASRGESAPGQVCSICNNDTVELCGVECDFCGIVAQSHGDYVSVIVKGFVTVPYTGSDPSVGYVSLSGDGTGNIRTCPDANSYLITKVDTVNKTVTILL